METSLLDTLEELMIKAWPAVETQESSGWLLRSTGAVTQRANSVWPVTAREDLEPALVSARTWYSQRGQPLIFQVTDRERNSKLVRELELRQFTQQSPTLIMTAPVLRGKDAPNFTLHSEGRPEISRVVLANTPPRPWLDLWWSVDGRGGSTEQAIALQILTGTPSLYASAVAPDGTVVGTARLTVHSGCGGVYCMAVHPQARRQGIGAALVDALLRTGGDAGAKNLCLMVAAGNTEAQRLYARAGFAEVARYSYFQAPKT